jgi:hypothetical protein
VHIGNRKNEEEKTEMCVLFYVVKSQNDTDNKTRVLVAGYHRFRDKTCSAIVCLVLERKQEEREERKKVEGK